MQCLDVLLLETANAYHRQRCVTSCIRPRPCWPAFAFLLWLFVHSWFLRLPFGSVSSPVLLPVPAPNLHVSTPVRRGAVADTRLGLE